MLTLIKYTNLLLVTILELPSLESSKADDCTAAKLRLISLFLQLMSKKITKKNQVVCVNYTANVMNIILDKILHLV